MAISLEPLTEHIGARVEGVDAMNRYAVLVFKQQPLTGEQQLAFSRSLGTLEESIGTSLRQAQEVRLEHATQPQFTYVHQWDLGDTVMWDNRQTMHRVRRFPAHEVQNMRRTTLTGEGPTALQANDAGKPSRVFL